MEMVPQHHRKEELISRLAQKGN